MKKNLLLKAIILFAFFAALILPAKQAQAARRGIDVSYHQGPIDWNQVKASGVEFAMIRAGSFKSGTDAYYHQNMAGATAVGIPVGVYVYSYATTPEMAMNEGLFAISVAKDYPVSLPIAYDIEDANHREMSAIQLQSLVNAFCNTVAAAGYHPIVYSSRNWFVQRIGSVSWDVWVAQYNTQCTYPGPYAIWQYTSSGSVPGIAGRVDLDYQVKDYTSVIPANGFKTSAGRKFYMENYKMHRGWLALGGDTYYFEPLYGVMATGLTATDKGICYFAEDGKMKTGAVQIGDFQFYFDPATGVLAPNVSVKIGKKNYITNEMGVLIDADALLALQQQMAVPADANAAAQ